MKDEDKGVLVGIGVSLFVASIIQLATVIDGDSDDIYPRHITQALAVCKNNGGLRMIDGEIFMEHKFICHNGAVFIFKPKRDTEESE